MTKPPLKYVLAAIWQWTVVGIALGVCVLLTYFPIGLIVAATAKPAQSPFNQGRTRHKDKYIEQGSSGWWEYWASSIKALKNWNNYEDGLLGEDSGKHSAREKGNERSFMAIYRWLCRNPFNYGKRTSRFFSCFVNDCNIQYWGSYDLSDKAPIVPGWYFIRAEDRLTGRVYYGYRYVADNGKITGWRKAVVKTAIALGNVVATVFGRPKRSMEGTVYNAVFGYKIKPSHKFVVQDEDDLDKAFTARVQFASIPD